MSLHGCHYLIHMMGQKMRLIDADALKAVFEEKSSEAVCGVELCKAIISRIDEAPTVDAEPVRHGEWEMKPDPFGFFHDIPVCSECGCTTKMREKTKHCPNCGARMDEE